MPVFLANCCWVIENFSLKSKNLSPNVIGQLSEPWYKSLKSNAPFSSSLRLSIILQLTFDSPFSVAICIFSAPEISLYLFLPTFSTTGTNWLENLDHLLVSFLDSSLIVESASKSIFFIRNQDYLKQSATSTGTRVWLKKKNTRL